jgi:hypothetical protein
VTIGKASQGDGVTVRVVAPLAEDEHALRAAALAELDALVDLFERALREPLPLACETSGAYATAVLGGARAERAARDKWEGGFPLPGRERRRQARPRVRLGAVVRGAAARGRPRRRARPGLGCERALALRPVRASPLAPPARRRARPGRMSTAIERPFDVCGPLPAGVTVLEASAGTGKTYTIAGLAARYVAEGIPLDRLLLVTFTRMATAELRDRVRERLVDAEHALDRVLAGAPLEGRDRVLRLLADGSREVVEQRRRRLAAAVADFDAATIVTTHGFCQEVLGGLGVAGDVEPGVTFVEDLGDLVEEVVDDLYVRAFHGTEDVPFDRAEASAIAYEAVRNPDAVLEPSGEGRESVPGRRRLLAEAVRAELDVRKRRLGVMDYDDLLTRLDRALDGPGGDEIAAKLRGRYGVVLVDEFQDTDPIQWRIVRRAFGTGETTLVLIGDPKTGDLRLPRRRRLRLPRRRRDRRPARDARRQLALGPGAARRLRRAVRRGAPRPRGDRLPARPGGRRERRAAAHRHARRRAPARARRRPGGDRDPDDPVRVRRHRRGALLHRRGPRERRRPPARVRRDDRGPPRGRHAGRHAHRRARATSRCSCAATPTPSWCARRSARRASPRCSTARAASSRRARPMAGCGCSRRSSARRRRSAPTPPH